MRIAERSRELAATDQCRSLPDPADGRQRVTIFGHTAMLHCLGMAQAGVSPIDRYVVVEHLTEGGMGTIYVGRKLGAAGFEMEVVLKQLLPEFTQQEEFIELFLREARLSATLHHANIIHTIDLVTTGGEYFIVMEYLPGADLRTMLRRAKRRGKRFSPQAAIYISREVLSALAYAHSKRDDDGNPIGLIHRDVSPANVLLSPAGEIKLTDFGIAKATKHTSRLYKVKGKVGYMSPEQARSEQLDHRSDLYSLAVCFYEILTGERLFVHAGLTTSADEIYSQPVPKLSRKLPGLPAEFDAIMASALAIDPNRRFQTAGEFQEALMRCAHRNGLLMSASALAAELRDACGPPELWRDVGDDVETNRPTRGGTEVYDSRDDDDGSVLIPQGGAESVKSQLDVPGSGRVRPMSWSARSGVHKFQGKELTSVIIKASDIEFPAVKPHSDPTPQSPGSAERPDDPWQSLPRDTAGAIAAAPSPPSHGGLAVPRLAASPPAGPPPPALDSPPQNLNGTAAPPVEPGAPLIPAWLLIGAILLVATIAATVVAMSGPTVHGR